MWGTELALVTLLTESESIGCFNAMFSHVVEHPGHSVARGTVFQTIVQLWSRSDSLIFVPIDWVYSKNSITDAG